MLFLGSSFAVVQGAYILGWQPDLHTRILTASLLQLALLLALFKAFTVLLEDKPLGSIGIYPHSRWAWELGVGIGLGLLLISGAVGIQIALGVAELDFNSGKIWNLLPSGLFFVCLFGASAANEELAFRGYPFQRLVESIGRYGATGVLSALFGFVHWLNPHHTWISTLNTMLVGVAFCMAYLRTRSLWLPTGLHFSWNLFQGFGFGIPVSGYELPRSLFRVRVEGAEYWTGGAYGLEGSLVATVVILLLMAYLGSSKSLYVTGDMRMLLENGMPVGNAEGRLFPGG